MILELLGIWIHNREPMDPNRIDLRTEKSHTQEPELEPSGLNPVRFFWVPIRFSVLLRFYGSFPLP
jgi:hypothetical protein